MSSISFMSLRADRPKIFRACSSRIAAASCRCSLLKSAPLHTHRESQTLCSQPLLPRVPTPLAWAGDQVLSEPVCVPGVRLTFLTAAARQPEPLQPLLWYAISAESRILAPLDHRCCNVRPLSSVYGHPYCPRAPAPAATVWASDHPHAERPLRPAFDPRSLVFNFPRLNSSLSSSSAY